MSVTAAGFFPYDNVQQGRSCGAFTTTSIIPTPRPVSARGTPRMGRPTMSPREALTTDVMHVDGRRPSTAGAARAGPAAASAASSRRGSQTAASSAAHAKYREQWTDTTESRDGIAAEHTHHHRHASERHFPAADRLPQSNERPITGALRTSRGTSSATMAKYRPNSARPQLRDVNSLLLGTEPPAPAQQATDRATAVRRQQMDSVAAGPRPGRPSYASSTPRIPGAARLSDAQRARARAIMAAEDRAAAAFAASAESFNPEAVDNRARRRERQRQREREAAVQQELVWARLRAEHTAAKVDELRGHLDVTSNQQGPSKPSSDHDQQQQQAVQGCATLLTQADPASL